MGLPQYVAAMYEISRIKGLNKTRDNTVHFKLKQCYISLIYQLKKNRNKSNVTKKQD